MQWLSSTSPRVCARSLHLAGASADRCGPPSSTRCSRCPSARLPLCIVRSACIGLTRRPRAYYLRKDQTGTPLAPEELSRSACPETVRGHRLGEVEATRASSTTHDGRSAQTSWKVTRRVRSLVAVVTRPISPVAENGCTHQLRKHCSFALQCPIVGDKKYGGGTRRHVPVGARAELSSPVPDGRGGVAFNVKIDPPAKFEKLLQREHQRWQERQAERMSRASGASPLDGAAARRLSCAPYRCRSNAWCFIARYQWCVRRQGGCPSDRPRSSLACR